ncbi:hypothetical protein Pmani_001896 [Petrolisthes manimaculis]|uniref:Uncharacterized protein n=1 Tax=Petrolisthes manimaculis TaxID=1843537 RepID=A0AAE1QJP4_9EUCA|nr:hypothetical protein Pmani_001896 [Petrolisthes manimaculis]
MSVHERNVNFVSDCSPVVTQAPPLSQTALNFAPLLNNKPEVPVQAMSATLYGFRGTENEASREGGDLPKLSP